MTTREPTHAGSWYSGNGTQLSRQLDEWLAAVPDTIEGVGEVPQPGARIIIAPHAGYSYSGPCAAYAYKSWDISKAKRIFLLGPSHHYPLSTLALPTCTSYLTPLSSDPLPLDLELISHLKTVSTSTSRFTNMTPHVDEDEHSLEMHLPYIHKMLSRAHPDLPVSRYPPLVPIMVGSTSVATERAFGTLLAPYLADPESAWVVSSDFCHWGLRFGYTYYVPSIPASLQPHVHSAHPPIRRLSAPAVVLDPQALAQVTSGTSLGRGSDHHRQQQHAAATIHESIAAVDLASMAAIHSGSHAAFTDLLRQTGNTVCGRHPIGVVMAAIEVLLNDAGEVVEGEDDNTEGDGDGNENDNDNDNESGKGMGETTRRRGRRGRRGVFEFVRYERSSDVVAVRDSSVSYVSAYAVL